MTRGRARGRLVDLGSALALVAVAWTGVAAIDAAARQVQCASEQEAFEARPLYRPDEAPERTRVFALLVDSLRAETADGLPAFRTLRARGAFVRVRPSRDAATVPSLRAAFTGQTQRSAFSFLRNFVRTGAAWDSLFTDLGARGMRSAVFSDGSFFELAAAITMVRNDEGPEQGEMIRQRASFEDALARFRSGTDQLVVFHLTAADHAAHAGGIRSPGYVAAFSMVDTLIREADAAVPSSSTLVVFGDHGHDRDGRHFPGLDVPTVAVYRGPGFQPGTAAGPLPLTIHRYLMSWALGLPLPPTYRGPGAIALLRAGAPVPLTYAAPPPEVSSVDRRWKRLVWMLPYYVALALGLAFAMRRSGFLTTRWPQVSFLTLFAGTTAAVAAFAAWGFFLVNRRLSTPPESAPQIFAVWAGGLAAAGLLVGSGVLSPVAAAVVALAAPALFLYPTAARDSWAAPMGRIWSIALTAMVVGWVRRRFLTIDKENVPLSVAEKVAFAALPLLAFCTMPFFYVEADGFVFGNWRGYLTSNWMGFWIILATGVRIILFVRPERGVIYNAVALTLVAFLSLVSFGDALPSQESQLAAAGLLFGLALLARVVRPTAFLSFPLANAACLMTFRGSVVLDERILLQLELGLAGLRVSQLLADVLATPSERRAWSLWLEAMAIVLAVWSTLALTLHRLEWRFLYTFIAPAVLERRVGWLLPLILARYAIPLLLARRLLAEARAVDETNGPGAIVGVAGLKVVTLTLVATGYGIFDPASELYMEALQNVLTFSVPLLALAWHERTDVRHVSD